MHPVFTGASLEALYCEKPSLAIQLLPFYAHPVLQKFSLPLLIEFRYGYFLQLLIGLPPLFGNAAYPELLDLLVNSHVLLEVLLADIPHYYILDFVQRWVTVLFFGLNLCIPCCCLKLMTFLAGLSWVVPFLEYISLHQPSKY